MIKLVFLLTLTAIFYLVRCDEIQEKVYYDLKASEDLFQKFITDNQKVYLNEEAKYRFKIFKENLKMINDLNEKHENTVFGLTPFSDLTNEEFDSAASCLQVNSNPNDVQVIESKQINLPKELDYRKQKLVTEVKDQSLCGSCYIFSAVGEIEGQYAKKHKDLVSLSEAYPLDCNDNFTCFGGDPVEVVRWIAGTPGALKTADYRPYFPFKFPCTADTKKGVAKVKSGQSLTTNKTDDLKQVLVDHGPLSIAIFVNNVFKSYKGGVLNPGCNGTENLNHGVVLIGYGHDKEDYWLIKNSWSSSWGEGGYVRLAVNSKCGVGEYVVTSEVE